MFSEEQNITEKKNRRSSQDSLRNTVLNILAYKL